MTRFSRVIGSNSAAGGAAPNATRSVRDASSSMRERRSADPILVGFGRGREGLGSGKRSMMRGRTKKPLLGRASINPLLSNVT
jgi:hypothetical protein